MLRGSSPLSPVSSLLTEEEEARPPTRAWRAARGTRSDSVPRVAACRWGGGAGRWGRGGGWLEDKSTEEELEDVSNNNRTFE